MKAPKNFFGAVTLKLPLSPPPAQEAPWNTLNVQTRFGVGNSDSFTYSALQLNNAILSQLELADTQLLTVRLISVKVWDLACREMQIRLLNPTLLGTSNSPAGVSQLATDIKYPPRDGFTAIGFMYPKAISATPIRVSSAALIMTGDIGEAYGIVNEDTTSLLLRFTVLWRTTQSESSVRTNQFLSTTKKGVKSSNSLNDVVMSMSNTSVSPAGNKNLRG